MLPRKVSSDLRPSPAKDPEFATKVDFLHQEYAVVSNATAELEAMHEYQNELKEERRKEQAQIQSQSAVTSRYTAQQ